MAASRRQILVALGGVIGGGATWFALRDPDVPLGENPDGVGPGVLPDYITSNADFYTFQNRPPPPPIEAAAFTLVLGDPKPLRELSWAELDALPRQPVTRTLQCLGNGRPLADDFSWRFGGISTATWDVVPLSVVLALAGLKLEAGRFLHVTGRDHFGRSYTAEQAMRDDFGLALRMNGEPLPHLHGFPARLIAPGEYGEKHIKWLRQIDLRDDPRDTEHPLKLPVFPMAFATTPRWGASVSRRIELGGVAYAGPHPVASVQVSVDGVAQDAKLLDPPAAEIWTRWALDLELPRGARFVSISCVDAAGRESGTYDPATPWKKSGQGVVHDLGLRVT